MNDVASVPVTENVLVALASTSLDTAISKTVVIGIFSATVTVLSHTIVGSSFTFVIVIVTTCVAYNPP